MLELPGPPLILQDLSMCERVERWLAHYQDVKGAFVGSPFLISKNQNWAIFGSDFAFIMEREMFETTEGRMRKERRYLCSFKGSSDRSRPIHWGITHSPGKLTNICVSGETST